jgi:hypothetical protein
LSQELRETISRPGRSNQGYFSATGASGAPGGGGGNSNIGSKNYSLNRNLKPTPKVMTGFEISPKQKIDLEINKNIT